MNNKIAIIDKLKAELDSLLPLNKESETKLWEKYRLEWNYNSNHIEGNTLSYGDTKLLFRLGDDFRAQNNSLKDVQEMRAHDVAIEMVKQWANDKDRLISESEIRALNETILVKPFWADALTPDGKPTRRQIIPGEYKEHPNHVQLKSGELFKYAEPNEVPQKMQELMDWYIAENEKSHPTIVAAFLHYKFVCIHPFDDGNGRVSRLLMNYHLLRNDYPPVIIKSKDKDSYLYALNQADAGDTDAFIKYVGEQLIWSLELQLKAAKGESIEEEDDLYKEIEVWKKNVLVGKRLKRSSETKLKIKQKFWDKFKKSFETKLAVFNDFFKDKTFKEYFYKNTDGRQEEVLWRPGSQPTFDKGLSQPVFNSTDKHNQEKSFLEKVGSVVVRYELHKPKITSVPKKFPINGRLHFYENNYTLTNNQNDTKIEKHYNETPTEEEVNQFLKALVKSVYEKMKAK